MREIGGYIELDSYHLRMLHEDAIALNCGRNALAYLLRARKITRLWLPRFLCSSVPNVCAKEGVDVAWYRVGMDFLPTEDVKLAEGEWFYFVNYYSQFDNETIAAYVRRYGRVIVDNAQSYFQMPLPGVDTIYTCRKYFGVADGAFLYTEAHLLDDWPRDESFDRMRFLLGRYERSATEFYCEYKANNEFFADQPIKRMSKLTWNLLHGIDYEEVQQQRQNNFASLHERLSGVNQLQPESSSFMYPLMLRNGDALRKQLQTHQIYIPTLWQNVFEMTGPEDTEHKMSRDILPLPIDQRYGISDMIYLANTIVTINERIEKCAVEGE